MLKYIYIRYLRRYGLLILLGFLTDVFACVMIIINYSLPLRNIQTPPASGKMNLANYYTLKGQPDVLGIAAVASATFGDLLAQEASHNTVFLPSPSPRSESAGIASSPKAVINNRILTVAVLGDSMVDTLGPDLPHLKMALKNYLPNVSIHLYNFGVGASDIDAGLTRLTNSYVYLGETKNSVIGVNPDILIVESFAYNHWENTKSDLDRHWLTLAKIVDTVKNDSPDTKIVLAAAIAPYCPTFTDGSANLPEPRKNRECAAVKAYLQNLVNFAKSQKLPLADAYHASLNGTEGNPKYINQGDHIHPSDAGKQLFSQKVAEQINRILNIE